MMMCMRWWLWKLEASPRYENIERYGSSIGSKQHRQHSRMLQKQCSSPDFAIGHIHRATSINVMSTIFPIRLQIHSYTYKKPQLNYYHDIIWCLTTYTHDDKTLQQLIIFFSYVVGGTDQHWLFNCKQAAALLRSRCYRYSSCIF